MTKNTVTLSGMTTETTASPPSKITTAPLTTNGDKGRPSAHRRTASLVGFLFLSATAAFASGDSLIASYHSGDAPDRVLNAGVILLAYTGLAVAGNGVAMFPVLRSRSPGLSQAYLALRGAESIALLLTSAYFLSSQTRWDDYVVPIYALAGAAGLVLSAALYRSGLTPRPLSILGLVGYVAILLGLILDLLDLVPIDSAAGFAFLAPGGLFELALPLFLLIRGFRRIS